MICPKCGFNSDTDASQCPKCGIFYIKWMISKYRSKSVERLRGFRLRMPAKLRGRIWPYALAAGFAAGIVVAPWLLTGGPRIENHYAAVKIPKNLFRERTREILEEAKSRAEPYGVRITPTDFQGYFSQGAKSFTLANIRAAEKESGRLRPTHPGTGEETAQDPALNFKCRVAGNWRYFKAAAQAPPDASECWAAVRTLKRKTIWDNPYEEILWNRLVWAAKKESWAYFTRERDQKLFIRHIADTLSKNDEREDLQESKAAARKAGTNRALLKPAILTAYRTRIRRAGARYRLEKLP